MDTKQVGALLGAALLSGCFFDSYLSSFSGEKSRIRGALSANVRCTEQGASGTMMTCGEGPLSVTLVAAGPIGIAVDIKFNPAFYGESDRLQDEFAKLAAAYQFTSSDVQQCISGRQHRRQFSNYSVSCQNMANRGTDLAIAIRLAKNV